MDHTKATEKERLLIHDGKGIDALKSIQARGYKYSDAVKILQATRKDIENSRKKLSKLNQQLNKAFRPIINKMLD